VRLRQHLEFDGIVRAEDTDRVTVIDRQCRNRAWLVSRAVRSTSISA
jgi:hypothetical protein